MNPSVRLDQIEIESQSGLKTYDYVPITPESLDKMKELDKGASEAKKPVEIENPVLDNTRSGSALKGDPQHAFNDIIDNYAGDATKFPLEGGDGVNRSLYQIEGSLNGKKGIFEWIVDPDPVKGVTHRRFIEGVGITGKPNARP